MTCVPLWPHTGMTMAENPSNFVRDWISENVRHDPSFDGDVKARVGATRNQLIADSRTADIPQDDPELAMDLLNDLIQAAIEETQGPVTGASQ